MSKKKIYFNVTCILLIFINFYFAGLILGKIGIIRDEYGITGRDNLISFSNEIIIFYLPIVIIILNIISLILKKMKKQVYVFISLLSICTIIVSSILIIKIRYDINHYQPDYIEMDETASVTIIAAESGNPFGRAERPRHRLVFLVNPTWFHLENSAAFAGSTTDNGIFLTFNT